MLKNNQLVYIIFILIQFASLAWGEGGEIGNGYTPYTNLLGQYSISYPTTWSYFDLNKSVSFVDESNLSSHETSMLSVIDRNFQNIRTVQDLLEQIKFFHPNLKWEPIKISNRDGFQSISNDWGIIYLLKNSENILSIRYSSAKREETILKIQFMLNSFKIN